MAVTGAVLPSHEETDVWLRVVVYAAGLESQLLARGGGR